MLCFRRAIDNAMATACFCGLPALISVRMLREIVLRERPFLSGIALLYSWAWSLEVIMLDPTVDEYANQFPS